MQLLQVVVQYLLMKIYAPNKEQDTKVQIQPGIILMFMKANKVFKIPNIILPHYFQENVTHRTLYARDYYYQGDFRFVSTSLSDDHSSYHSQRWFSKL